MAGLDDLRGLFPYLNDSMSLKEISLLGAEREKGIG